MHCPQRHCHVALALQQLMLLYLRLPQLLPGLQLHQEPASLRPAALQQVHLADSLAAAVAVAALHVVHVLRVAGP